MKIWVLVIFAFLSLVARTHGAQPVAVPAPTQYNLASSGADWNIWQRTVYEVSPSGQTISKVQSYKECASGLNFKDPVTGQYRPAQGNVEILQDGSGASATNGCHQCFFPVDIGDGVITSVGPLGTTLRSEPVGLFYDTGTNLIMVAGLTNSIGEVVGSNVVVYPNALGPAADLRYTYRKNGLEQEVILRQRLAAPESFGGGLSSANARLELVTEFFNAPTPAQSAPISGPLGLSDSSLSFGELKFVRGKAFSIGGSSLTNSQLGGVGVFKSWAPMGNGNSCLIEALPYAQVSSYLSALPAASSAVHRRRAPVQRALLARLLPPEPAPRTGRHRMRVATAPFRYRDGLDLDYQEILGTETNFTFAGDSTFLITGTLDLFGTTTVSGGTVVKYPQNSDTAVYFYGPVNCDTAGSLPATFTASDDNSVGSAISGSSGSPTGVYANEAIVCDSSSSVTLHDLKINYAETALNLQSGTSNVIRDVQFVNDCYPLFCSEDTNYLENALMWNATNVCISENNAATIAENVTVDGGGELWDVWAEPSTLAATNCLFVGLESLGGAFAGDHNVSSSSDSGVFETAGGGGHYLPADSPYRGQGTPNIDPALLTDLGQKTTQAPIVFDNTNISGLGTLGPVVRRDTNAPPDLGWHYSPLDWVFAGCTLNSTLTITAGTAVGWFEDGSDPWSGEPFGIVLAGGANLSFDGSATQPCIFARYAMVQEAENGNWTDSGWAGAIVFDGGSPEPQLSADFTKVMSDNWNGNLFRDTGGSGSGAGSFKNSEWYNSTISTYNMTSLVFTNCLFYRFNQSFWHSPNLAFENCTFYNGGMYLSRSSSKIWSIENCSFDGTALTWSDPYNGTNYTTIGFNAYDTNNLSWTNYPYFTGSTKHGTNEVVGVSDVMVTNYNWQTISFGFGSFYLPPDSQLIMSGSTTADQVGLYEFTTQTNQIPEGASVVDIGYHYVAADSDGNPLDTYVSGVPNYIVDAQGNGMDTNGLAYWWEAQYFGQIGLNPNSDPDNSGYTLLYDYTNGIDPNIIQFSITATNQYIGTNGVPLQLSIEGGIPVYITFVDGANFTSEEETWYPYTSSNIVANLAPINGEHNLWIGLRGLATNGTVAWQEITLTMSTNAPVILVTSPIGGTVSEPLAQIQGFANENLSSLTFDVSNATGLFTNQIGYLTGQYYDTNALAVTAYDFQLFDVALTSGSNTVTIHATDFVGNTETTNLVLVLDYSGVTNPPALSIVWPQNGTLVSGSNFTLHAQVDDLTAGVTATIMDTNGDTNVVAGAVQRNGNVWAVGLPIAPGTNILSVTATNAAGLSVTTNLTLVQSPVIVTIDPLSSDQYNQTSVNVTGTISSTNESLTVNSVSAAIDLTNGTWSATNVPVSAAGMEVFDLEAYVGDPDTNASVQVATLLPPTVTLLSYSDHYRDRAVSSGCHYLNFEDTYWVSGVGGVTDDGFWSDCSSSSTNPGTLGPDYYDGDSAYYLYRSGTGTGIGSEYFDSETTLSSIGLTTGGEGQPRTMQTYLVLGEAQDNSNGSNLPPTCLKIRGHVLQGTEIADDYGGQWGYTGLQLPAGTTNNISVSAPGTNYTDNSKAGLLTLIVVSNSAVQINGTTNWATVENASNYVYVQATLAGGGSAIQEAATNIVWSGGEPVPGNPLERKVSTAVTTNTIFTASIGPASTSLEVWVLWSTVQVLSSGTNTSTLSFPSYAGGNELGAENLLSNDPPYLGWKVEMVGTITPAGAYQAVPNGWRLYQTLTFVDFYDDEYVPSASGTNAPDTAFNAYGSNLEDDTPDTNNDIYALDGPGYGAPFTLYQSTANFQTWILWNGQIASAPPQWWTSLKAYNNGSSYIVVTNTGGNGTTQIEQTY